MKLMGHYKKRISFVKRIKKRLAKIRVGLPKKVIFEYEKGKVICYPKLREWHVTPKGKKTTILIISAEDRNDVTKFKARWYLKLAILGKLRSDR